MPSEAPVTSQPQETSRIVSSTPSTSSRIEPSTPVPHTAASDFPSLDQMAAVSKEQRSVTRPSANRAAFAASFPATSLAQVPSSLPRPTAPVRTIRMDESSDDNQRARAARSSLTNGALQRVRQEAGDETPLGVSQARASRQALAATASASASSSKANRSLLADNSGDSTAQLVPGRRDAALNPLLANIDVENPQMPSLVHSTVLPRSTALQSTQSNAQSVAPSTIDAADAAAAAAAATAPSDSSIASQASIFGTANRRNGRDQPVGAASAGTAYDFSKYLDGELDPFNRASRADPRRESRPLPALRHNNVNEDAVAAAADTSGDTTARGGLAASAKDVLAKTPIESTPLPNRVKTVAAAAATTPRMSPHVGPSVSSRKLAHLSSLANGHIALASSNSVQSAAVDDTSTVSLAAAYNRFDPSARTDRIQTMELGELRKKATALSLDLAAAQDALASAKEETEGWASECTGLQEQIATLKATHGAASEREARARNELQVRLNQYKIEADDRAWKLLAQRRQAWLIDVALQHAKNEATYHEGRYHATEAELEGQKDELRIRLMLEKKRADLLALHVKAALRDGARLKKRLGVKSAALHDLQSENQRLEDELEDARHSQRSTGHTSDKSEMKALKKQLEEAQAEIETLNERDAMMAETRKKWKAERRQLMAQVEELSSAAAAPIAKAAEAPKPFKSTKSLVSSAATATAAAAAAHMLPPSSPVYARKKKPMQGASELEPPSEAEEVYQRFTAATTTTTAHKASSASASKTSDPLVPFARISGKTASAATKNAVKPTTKPAAATSKTKSSKNWRDDVAITDSSEESDLDADDGAKRKGRASKPKSSSTAATKRGSTKLSSGIGAGARRNKASMPIEYDDQTADPSATPIIRSTKRTAQESEDDDGALLDSSVLGSKFGRDRTNLVAPLAQKSKLTGGLKPMVACTANGATDAGVGKKKKRKLLGGGGAAGAMQWSDAGGLAPNFDIPLELSPIKGPSKGNAGGAAAFLTGFGMPARNPLA